MVLRQVHDVEPEATRDIDPPVAVARRVEEQQSSAGHQCGAYECLGAGIRVIAVHDNEPGTNAPQRSARDFLGLRKVWLMSGELDGGTKQGSGERVRGKDQYIVTTHIVSLHTGSEVGCRDRAAGASKRETNSARSPGAADP